MIPGPRIDSAVVERLVDEEGFRVDRITAAGGEIYEADDGHGIVGYTVVDGAVQVERAGDGKAMGEFFKGQSFIVPAAMGAYSIKGNAEESVLFETRESD